MAETSGSCPDGGAVHVSSMTVQVMGEVDAQKRWDAHFLELLSDAGTIAKRMNGNVGAWLLTDEDMGDINADELRNVGCNHLHHLKNA